MSETPLKGWNHVPDVPLQVSPFFRWPLRPLAMLKWVWDAWFLVTERLIIVGIAFISITWFQPPLVETQTLAVGWIAQMYLRNLILMSAVAGGLHLYFYTFTKQGQRLKYDPRPLMKNGRQSHSSINTCMPCITATSMLGPGRGCRCTQLNM